MKYTEAKKILLQAFQEDNVQNVKLVEASFDPEYVLDFWASVSDFTLAMAVESKVRDYLGPKSPQYQTFLRMSELMEYRLGEIVCNLEGTITSILDEEYAEEKTPEGREASKASHEFAKSQNWPDNTIKGTSAINGYYLSVDDPLTNQRYAVCFKVEFEKISSIS